jgi:hypothetical protein
MEEFPSGQRGQTVNLLAMPSVVRIHPPPPTKILHLQWMQDFSVRLSAPNADFSSFHDAPADRSTAAAAFFSLLSVWKQSGNKYIV